MNSLTWIIVIIIILLIAIYIAVYNGLQKAKVYTDESWSQIDVQLKRRNDLIPNLVETTKGYAKHEKETLENVVQLRNQLTNIPSDDHAQTLKVSNQISDALKSIFALSENYPDLKANQNFLKLQEELTNTENKIAYSRQLYNSSAALYDQKLLTFPSNIVAHIHGFKKVDYLQTSESEKEVPKVKF
ncbi:MULTISPECIES: LemA family protein [Lactobacillus]|uniref:LemA family protein n=1 Tax=Lactobacillus melliventris TaxID=1218507 RepID=A0ABX5N492_9LACO|nr:MULTISPECIES: LemA family protein [Lactobacillus]MBC6349510.1 LemA family protein [Lactobacillus melliventris]MBH9988959.1 LemA family protein [Lactobacillus sp. M0392]MBI0023422.1 LemA family protein [Lactobacillus sp. W8171]MBI0043827.1 LemA family protein [Lactobacillus sp. M0393]NUE97755.1 LemA family protein [Lactobacillus melliventris]